MWHCESETIHAVESDANQLEGHSPQPQDLVGSVIVTDFARKLYDMLEDLSIQSIVRWGPKRDCFIVKDMKEFSNTVLPRIFNHSNFASFVRQLNKYDFHKIKQTEFNQAGGQTATFRHRYFHGDRPDDLKNIKRKVITNRPMADALSGSLSSDMSLSDADSYPTALLSSRENRTIEIERCMEENEDLKRRIHDLESDQDAMWLEMDRVGTAIALHNEQMQGLTKVLGFLGARPNSAISLAQGSPSISTLISMSMPITTSSSVGLGLTSAMTGNMAMHGPLTGQPQYYLPSSHNLPTNTRPQGEIDLQPAHAQPSQVFARTVDPYSIRFPEEPQDIPHFDHTYPVSPSCIGPVVGSNGQASQATLSHPSQPTATDSSSRAHHGPDNHVGQWNGMSFREAGRQETSERSEGQIEASSRGYHVPQDGEMGEEYQDQPDTVRSAPSPWYDGQAFEGVPPGLHLNGTRTDASGGRDGRRWRSLSPGSGKQAFAEMQPQASGRALDPPTADAFVRSTAPGVENKSREVEWSGERRRRGSDSAALLHCGDPGGGDFEMELQPWTVPAETQGGWSFDTTNVARTAYL